jgi:Cys-rich protein (TIGR01571 family)
LLPFHLQPKTGVQKGDLFHAEVVRKIDVKSDKAVAAMVMDPSVGVPGNLHDVPTGRWRDGLCDCCIHGCCHALCCLAFWCRPIALGQVMYRMNLSLWGNSVAPGNNQSISPFKFMVALVAVYFIITNSIAQAFPPPPPNPDGTITFDSAFRIQRGVINGLALTFGLFLLVLTVKTRAYIRRTYSIPESSCVGCEDVCCSLLCGSCVVAQMARHTVDYTKHHPSCCTDTGLDEIAPPMIASNRAVLQGSAHIV